MIDVFPLALEFVLKHEGGYSNQSADEGGETYAGISRIYHPYWEGWKTIDEIKEEYTHQRPLFPAVLHEQLDDKVNAFYKSNYWTPMCLSEITNEKIAIKLFDMAVNLGIARTVSLVQICLNLMSSGLGYEITIDKTIGAITIRLINEMTKNDNGDFLLKLLTLQQGGLYMKLAQNNREQRQFIHGWINRLGILHISLS